jgi:hypothetical protein
LRRRLCVAWLDKARTPVSDGINWSVLLVYVSVYERRRRA